MTLPALTWRALPEFTVSATTSQATFVTTIRNALTGTVYADGSTRTPGSGVAWTSSVAADGVVVCTPVTSSMGLKVLFKSSPSVQSTQSYALGASPSLTYSTLGSMILDGTYTATNVASPVSSGGRFFGWVHHTTLNAQNFTSIKIYESQDALCIVSKQASNALAVPFLIGGFIDPESSSHPDGEIDGRLYAVCTPGNVQAGLGYYYPDFVRTYPFYFMGHGDGGANYPLAGYFLPGSSTTSSMRRIGTFNFPQVATASSHSNKSFNSNYVTIPIFASSAYYFVGRYREIYPGPQAINGQVLKSGSTENGFLVGYSTSTANDTILLKK
jgi:hypothetical protein